MHELSLAEDVLRIVEDVARNGGFRRVRKVVLEIGRLAAVEPEAMRFCFDAVVRDSLADSAVLEIIEVPGSGWCEHCAATVPLSDFFDTCPDCGGYPLKAIGGMDMKVMSLEME